ncbi:MAG TPA: hypothetical protein DCM28_02375, partial [Phycisphaerales bacterium]|nr:hypothetical protein [Phycisphaerales bacterium]
MTPWHPRRFELASHVHKESTMTLHTHQNKAFTLIELLVVISIISLLIAVL